MPAIGDGSGGIRGALPAWARRSGPLLRASLVPSLAGAVALLAAGLLVARLLPGYLTPGAPQPGHSGRLAHAAAILSDSVGVLALHALACAAGFIAGAWLPRLARSYTGWTAVLHRRAGQLIAAFLIDATLFSLSEQAMRMGAQTAGMARALGVSPELLLMALAPHVLPELTVLFLPLAAWRIASRRRSWDALPATAGAIVMLALPVLAACAAWEAYVSPHVIAAVTA